MRLRVAIPLAAMASILAGCNQPQPKSSQKAPAEPLPPKITQFYATAAQLQSGDRESLCYGVENAIAVSLSPPPQELTASRSRCVEIAPSETTTYRLTVAGAGGQSVAQDLTVVVGPPKPKILEVRVSALDVRRGDLVSICYGVSNTATVTVEPIKFRAGGGRPGCATHQPTETTTYVVTAHGANQEKDQEKVTVKVR